jgi:hypothetical protein
MKRLIFAVAMCSFIFASPDIFSRQNMSIHVREAVVRSTPNYMGGASGKVFYGDKVTVLSEDGNWVKIASPSGYLPKSVVTKKSVPKNPDQKYAGGSFKHDEVALAGKGFNPQVEAEHKKGNTSLASAYLQVDRIEGFDVSDAELKAFQTAGELNPR